MDLQVKIENQVREATNEKPESLIFFPFFSPPHTRIRVNINE